MGGIDLLARKLNVVTQPGKFLGYGLASITGEEPGNSQQDSTACHLEKLRCALPVSPYIQISNAFILEFDDNKELILGNLLKLDVQEIYAAACHRFRSPHHKT